MFKKWTSVLVFSSASLIATSSFSQQILPQSHNEVLSPSTTHLYDFTNVDQLIMADVVKGFPGATLGVWYKGEIVNLSAYGYTKIHDENTPKRELGSGDHNNAVSLPDSELVPTNVDTIYDLASNTKMYSTNYALQYLVSQGKLDLDSKVEEILPLFKDNYCEESAETCDIIQGKALVTVRDLLHHTAGNEPTVEYYMEEGELYSQQREKTLELMLKTDLKYPPHTVAAYSDIDYMILGQIIEKLTGQRQDEFMDKTFYAPLGLDSTGYNLLAHPVNGHTYTSDQFGATEVYGNTREGQLTFENIRTYTLQGEVHDEKTFYSMGGIAGHAGLFSNAQEMLTLMSLMMNGGSRDGVEYFTQDVIEEFVTLNPDFKDKGYALGWNVNYNKGKSWLFGDYASESTFGHSGWVGTASLIDPENQVMIILLANKKNTHIKMDCGSDFCGSFEGDSMNVGRYGVVMEEVYKSLGLADETQFSTMSKGLLNWH